METNESTHINNDEKPTGAEHKAPDERSGIWLESFIRITDPESGEIIVETRT